MYFCLGNNDKGIRMKNKKFKVSLLVSLICFSSSLYGEDYFDPAMLDSQLGIDVSTVDLSQFSRIDSIPVGEYPIQVLVNRNNLGDKTISFIPDNNGKVVPELTPVLLEEWGVNIKAIKEINDLSPDTVITNLSDYIPDATITADIANLKLTINIPQIAMSEKAEGYIDPSMLDDGVTALFFNYFISGNRQWTDTVNDRTIKDDSVFASVQGGGNIGVWRLRSNMSYSRTDGEYGSHSNTSFTNTHIMRAISSIRSTLVIGETFLSNDIFDSIPFKGVKLASDEQMLPSSMRGFAPEVNGIAQSNAKVTVRQNGYVVYQTYVSPGAFSLKDISPSGNTGDLDVTVTEEDGTEKVFSIAFSSLPVMLRPGGFKYELAAGRYDGGVTDGTKEAEFITAGGIYGLPVNTTLYGGVLAADKYVSVVGGAGVSLGMFGAFSVDITHANADFGGNTGTKEGQSYRLRYSKSMTTTGTSVDLTALRYSTRDYYSFDDFNNQGYKLKDGVAPWLDHRQRSMFTTSVSQSLGQYGSVYLSGSIYDYWELDREVRQMAVGYTGAFKGINYSLNYSINRVKAEGNWPENRQFSTNISIPFSIFSNSEAVRNISSTMSYSRDNNNRASYQAGISGSLLEHRLSYGITQGYMNQGQGSSGSIYGNYSGNSGTANLSYNYSRDSRSVNGSLGGGVVLHSGGILLSQSTGGSMAIIEAPGAAGTELGNSTGHINRQGYGLYPYVTSYNANNISLNVNTLPDNVMLTETSKTIYPTAGAVVRVKFDTRLGYQAIINLKRADGSNIPFGAIATFADKTAKEENTGIVGDNNQLFMSGLTDSGQLHIGWGRGKKQQCIAAYADLGAIPVSQEQPIRSFSAVCK